MKLLYITKNIPFGKDEAFILAEVQEHLNNGVEVLIVPVQGGVVVHEEARKFLSLTIKCGLLNFSILCYAVAEFFCKPHVFFRIFWTIISRSGGLLVFRNLAVLPKGMWLARVARKNKISHIHCHWIAVPATMAWIASGFSGVHYSITAHRYDIAQNNLLDFKFLTADFVRAIDSPGRDELTSYLTVDVKPPLLIRMGVSVGGRLVELRSGKLDSLRLIIGARLIPKKGHETLIRAVAAAKDGGQKIQLQVFGDGPLEDVLKELVNDLRLSDSVFFRGVASHDRLIDEISSGNYDAAVLPSVTATDGDKEGIPVFLMEAMSAGLPVISTPNGGIAELLHGGAGLMVAEFDHVALAQSFLEMARNSELRLSLSVNGRARILNDFSIASCASELRAHFTH